VILVGSTEKNIDCSVLGGGLQVNNPAAFFNAKFCITAIQTKIEWKMYRKKLVVES
jgi:hypothetical protein